MIENELSKEQLELCANIFQLFEVSDTGKYVLNKLNETFANAAIYPVDPNYLKCFGEASVYSGYRAGQASVCTWIMDHINIYKNRATPKDINY